MALCENFPAHSTSLLQRAAGGFVSLLTFRSSLAPGSQPNPRVRNQHLKTEMAPCKKFPAHSTSLLQRAAGGFFSPLTFSYLVAIKDAPQRS
ncbi:hypothetical protein CDAR_582351 [Caerostris darwini]|uniref:Uncharacterized protein n=1 Tax=Caerostris darwini TaxID=1538125 RepID=A0AAV4RKS9_9ARAC|nr:hypothetical protein CDAR_582351 [Caerostris darwini]